jgi:hypothetical protein
MSSIHRRTALGVEVNLDPWYRKELCIFFMYLRYPLVYCPRSWNRLQSIEPLRVVYVRHVSPLHTDVLPLELKALLIKMTVESHVHSLRISVIHGRATSGAGVD